MDVKDLKRIIREESENVVIDFEQKKREREHKARVQQIILDSIESHGISLIVGIPDEQAEQIRNGMAKHGNAFLHKLLDYMFSLSMDKKSGFRLLQHLKDIHDESLWPSYEEQINAFSKGVTSALEEYYSEPEPEEPRLRLVPDEEELDEKLALKPGAGGWDKYAQLVGKAYMEAPDFDPDAVSSYKAMIPFIEKMFKQIQTRVKVEFVNYHPYKDADELRQDVKETGVLRIATADSDHPIFTNEQNVKFRAIHDYMSHIQAIGSRGTEFSLRGEIAAYNVHLKTIPKAAIPALFTEVIGQVCAYYYLGGRFPDEQKIAILDGFDYINVGKVKGMDIKDKELVNKQS